MRVLLDTHVWLWQLLEPERLSRPAATALAAPDHDLYLSPISVWETLVLARRGRLRLEPDPESWVRRGLGVSPTVMVPLSHEIALRSEALDGFDPADPADRFLLATCAVEDLTLVTSDRQLLRQSIVATLW